MRRAPWLVNGARILWRIRQPKFTAGVVGVIFADAGQMLLVEHVFHPYTPWGLPGGWVDRREDPMRTLERELMEELELTITVGPILLAQIDTEHHIDMAYLCRCEGSVGRLSGELLAYRWLPPAERPQLRSFHEQAVRRALEVHPQVQV